MKSNKQIKSDAKRLFRLCLIDGLLDDLRVRQAVQGVIGSNRRSGHAVLSYFLRLVRLDRSRHTAEVQSATALSPDLQASVLAGVERVYGPGMKTSFSENPALIGGMRIRVASDLYDGSIKAGLAALEKSF